MTFNLDFWQRLLDLTQAQTSFQKTFDILLLPTSFITLGRGASCPLRAPNERRTRAERAEGNPKRARYKMDFGPAFVWLRRPLAVYRYRLVPSEKGGAVSPCRGPEAGLAVSSAESDCTADDKALADRMRRFSRVLVFSESGHVFAPGIFAENHRVRERASER